MVAFLRKEWIQFVEHYTMIAKNRKQKSEAESTGCDSDFRMAVLLPKMPQIELFGKLLVGDLQVK